MGRVVEVVVWWALLLGVWLLTLSALSLAELVTGVVAALPCAVLAAVGRRAVGGAWRVRSRWLRWLLPLPLTVLADSCQVLLVPMRRQPRRGDSGRLREIRLRPEGSETVAGTQKAIATTVVSVAPGTFVVDVRPDADVLVVHSLVDGRGRVEEAVRS